MYSHALLIHSIFGNAQWAYEGSMNQMMGCTDRMKKHDIINAAEDIQSKNTSRQPSSVVYTVFSGIGAGLILPPV